MENFEKLILAIVTFTITSVIAYLFRMRQLYVAVPKLFRYSPVSSKGSICELIVFNKGNYSEESIQVVLDPALTCELLASSEAEVTLERNTLKIDRLHKGQELSAILLVEQGLLDHSKIVSITSKSIKGTVLKKVTDVPPNFAKFALALTAIVMFVPGMIYGERAVSSLNRQWVESRLSSAYKLGWSGLETRYSGSELRKSYGDHEFPIRLTKSQKGKNESTLTYEILNKTAVDLKVLARGKSSSPDDDAPVGTHIGVATVPPLSKGSLTVTAPLPTSPTNQTTVEFSLTADSEFVFGLVHTMPSEFGKPASDNASAK